MLFSFFSQRLKINQYWTRWWFSVFILTFQRLIRWSWAPILIIHWEESLVESDDCCLFPNIPPSSLIISCRPGPVGLISVLGQDINIGHSCSPSVLAPTHSVSVMIMTASGGVQGKVSDVQECAGCNKKIHDKFVLKVSLGWMLEYNYSGASLLEYCRPWTSTGTRTVSSAAAVTPDWARSVSLSTPRGTSSSARETTSGSLDPRATALPARRSSRPLRWWWEPGPTSTIWSASLVRSVATGSVWATSSSCTTTRCSVVLTTRRGWSSPHCPPTPPSWRLSSTRTTPATTTTTTTTTTASTSYQVRLPHHNTNTNHNLYLPSQPSGQRPHSC